MLQYLLVDPCRHEQQVCIKFLINFMSSLAGREERKTCKGFGFGSIRQEFLK